MENILKFFKKPTPENPKINDTDQKLLDEIKDICKQIASTEQWFQSEKDSDLIEACIHQREVLYAKYRYLIRKAKNSNIYVPPFEVKCV